MGGVRGLLLDCVLSFKYKFLHLCHVVGFERHGANEHGIEDNSGTPDVSFESVSFACSLQNFRCDICRCSALLV